MTKELTEKDVFDVTSVEKDDVIRYYNYDQGKFLIDSGVVKGVNSYFDGVDVFGEGWRQYVSKFMICQVIRNGEVIFQQEDCQKNRAQRRERI